MKLIINRGDGLINLINPSSILFIVLTVFCVWLLGSTTTAKKRFSSSSSKETPFRKEKKRVYVSSKKKLFFGSV
jgi:hypothetical protein